MRGQIIARGKNITHLQQNLLRTMVPEDATRVVEKAEELIKQLPEVQPTGQNRQGLMLGLIQSGKTVALTTAIAMAADNGYRCFIVLTSDNLWLYDQTIRRLKKDLPGLQVQGKDDWDRGLPLMPGSLNADGLVVVATKNAGVLSKLNDVLDRLGNLLKAQLPTALLIDDEADQASLDTQKRRRVKNPSLDPGRINDLITKLRHQFPTHAFLQVTATPQALFLQEQTNLYRPEFTIVLEPGQGYVGGETFFSRVLLRHK